MAYPIVLTPSDGAPGDGFGYSVAISGGTIIVGAPGGPLGYTHPNWTGAAYVFQEPAGGWTNMNETCKLEPSVGGGPGDYFGTAVAISGDTAAVTDFSTGSAFVFKEPATGWPTSMTQTAKLTTSGIWANGFGTSVATNGTTVVVGAPLAGGASSTAVGPGAAFVFEMPATGWADETQTAVLTNYNHNPDDNDQFGLSVAISGHTIVVGAPLASVCRKKAFFAARGRPPGLATDRNTRSIASKEAFDQTRDVVVGCGSRPRRTT